MVRKILRLDGAMTAATICQQAYPRARLEVPEIFIKVRPLLAAIWDLNKHTYNHVLHAARLAVLLAGSGAVASLPSSKAAADSRIQTGPPNAPLSAMAHVD